MTELLRFRDVTKRAKDGRSRRTLLQSVSFGLGAGEVAMLRGPSGSGKTTLLSLAGLLAAPTSGEVEIDGQPTSRLRDRARAHTRRHGIGFVFQHAELLADLDVLDNVLLPTMPLGVRARDRDRARELLARFGVAELAGARAATLSGGERQRVALARALFFEPRLLLCDEPTAHLDVEQGERFLGLLAEHAAEGRAVLVATHDPRVVSALPAARSLWLEAGSLREADGGPAAAEMGVA